MPKKIKQKQKQRQKQSVVVNVNLAKSSRKSSNKQINKSNKQNLPPPVHKVYTSPIHDLTPQIFSNGKQITQPSLAEQINAYLLTIGQGQPTNVLGQGQPTNVLGQGQPTNVQNVLGALPSKTVDSSQFTEPKKLPRMPLRQIYYETDTDADVLRPNINLNTEIDTDVEPPLGVKRKSGRKKGSKNKPKPSAENVQSFYPAEIIGVSQAEPKEIPTEFMREQFGLRQPQNNPDENYYSVFTSPRPVDQPINEFMREQVDQPINEPRIRKKKIKNKKQFVVETDEENL